MGLREDVLRHLSIREVNDVSGFATRKLAVVLGCDTQRLATVLWQMERKGLVERRTRGKRTFCIRLAEDSVVRRPSKTAALKVENRQLRESNRAAQEQIRELVRQLNAARNNLEVFRAMLKDRDRGVPIGARLTQDSLEELLRAVE